MRRALLPALLAGSAIIAGTCFTAGASYTVAASGAAATRAGCVAPLTLVLRPGFHWPGAGSHPIPKDLPPGNITVHLPRYPDADPTKQREPHPDVAIPADDYYKSASVTYLISNDSVDLAGWYAGAFTACGYTAEGQSESGGPDYSSYGIAEKRKSGRNTLWMSLSFEAAPDGGTLVLYAATALTPPLYPVRGSILRVPGSPVAVRITQYAGMNDPQALQPLRTVTIRDRLMVVSLAHEINELPKSTQVIISCPADDGARDTLIFRDVDRSRHKVTINTGGCPFVVAPPAPPGWLYDDPRLLPRINTLLAQGSPQSPQSLTLSVAQTLRACPATGHPRRPVSVRGYVPIRFRKASSSVGRASVPGTV